MPSNKELTDTALGLGQKLGVEVVTQGLNNAGLVALVEELTGEFAATLPSDGKAPSVIPAAGGQGTLPSVVAASDAVAAVAPVASPDIVDGSDEATVGGPPQPGTLPAQRYNYMVAEGKSVTTRRGPVGAFQPISAQELGDGNAGEEVLQGLVASGHVSKL